MLIRVAPILCLFLLSDALAQVPATPLMTLYRFNASLDIPYYAVSGFKQGPRQAGTLAQGTSVIPCLVIDDGRPLTDTRGTPFVGFDVIVDSRRARPSDTERFRRVSAERKQMRVQNHHCSGNVRHVLNVRNLYQLDKAPAFDPPPAGRIQKEKGRDEYDRIIRAFHNSSHCARANENLIGRRHALANAWDRFISQNKHKWNEQSLLRSKHLDYTMRTALFEGHLDRGCNAYGACERNVVALSIRNRGRSGSCKSGQGCRFPGDYQGVSSKPSQYNIWDEFLAQISGLTSCFLRDDLGGESEARRGPHYEKLRRMYAQNLDDVRRILYGTDRDLSTIFGGVALGDLKELRHYYHAPAMGKCFPNHSRVEYMSGAVAKNGSNYALIADTRVRVGAKQGGWYEFDEFRFDQAPKRDVVRIVDAYPGYVVDARKVSLGSPSRCYPYGIPRGCRFDEIGRYRRTPSWLSAGKPLELRCRIQDRGEDCKRSGREREARVGGVCDLEMRPVTAVP